MTKLTKLLALLLLAAVALQAEPVATALAPGRAVPEVVVRDENNTVLKLRELVAGHPTVLIFYRGGWCPYCQRHLQGLAGIEADLRAAGVQLLAISVDQPAKLRETPGRDQLGYRLLSDSDGDAIKAFGIAYTVDDKTLAVLQSYHIDLEAATGNKLHLLPHPAVFVVDAAGVIRFSHAETDYKVRLAPEKILAAARAVTERK